MKKFFENTKIFCVKNRLSAILVSLCILLLIAGTAVLMASGAVKAIENIRVGDMVKSYNANTGKVENKRVLQTFENETNELVTISTSDGQHVTATPGHKFFANNEWVSAEDLRAGDVLVNVNGERVIVEQIKHEIIESPIIVYNFSVDGNQNYYVSQNLNSEKSQFVLVHNTCQKHHVVTKKIKTEMNNNPNLKNVSRNKSSIFQAKTEGAHKGYQEWHRKYDDDMVKWLQQNPNATLTDFQTKLQEFYNKPEIVEKFGDVVVQVFVPKKI